MQISNFTQYQNLNLNSNTYLNKRNVNFTGYTSAFGRRLESVMAKNSASEEDKACLVFWIRKFLSTKINPKNKLGEGAHGAVYRIDDKFCMKIPVGKEPQVDGMDDLPNNLFGKLKSYYGGKVAVFSDVEVLKNVSSGGKHTQIGVPDTYRSAHIASENHKFYEKECLPRLAKLPQKSFDVIVADCAALNAMSSKLASYVFDYKNPNNFVIVGKSIRILDDVNVKQAGGRNSLADLFDALINKIYLNHCANFSESGKKYRQEVFKKLVLAAMKTDIPIKPKMQADDLTWYITTQDLCRFDDSNEKIIDKLAKFQNIKDQKSRLEKAKKYLDKISQE